MNVIAVVTYFTEFEQSFSDTKVHFRMHTKTLTELISILKCTYSRDQKTIKYTTQCKHTYFYNRFPHNRPNCVKVRKRKKLTFAVSVSEKVTTEPSDASSSFTEKMLSAIAIISCIGRLIY